MKQRDWYILREGEAWLLARRLPADWSLSAETTLARVHPIRLMHQIRQDIWRAAQDLRGYSPLVRLYPDGGEWRIRAGGAVSGPVAGIWQSRLSEVLEDEGNRARWIRHAGPWGENA